MVNGHCFDPLTFLGIFLTRCVSYAFLTTIFFHPGVAILRKHLDTLALALAPSV